MWRFVLPSVLLAGSAFGATYEMGKPILATPPSVKVASKLVATQILEIETLGEVRIIEPRLEFDQDIGFGLEVWPNMIDSSNIAAWICAELGYGSFRATVGKRTLTVPWVLEYLGTVGDPRSLGLRVQAAKCAEVPQTLICELKKK